MNIRELIILLLGFAIIAVILRGLYIAFQARRGQIRLAIDKNIPQNVDLESLELAELPAGGARVVSRADRQDSEPSAVEAANLRAESLNLGATQKDGAAIPVLMDAVEISLPETEALTEQVEFADEFANDYAVADEGFIEDAAPTVEASSAVEGFLSAEDAAVVEEFPAAEGSLYEEDSAYAEDAIEPEDSFSAQDSPALGDMESLDESVAEDDSESLDGVVDPDSVLFDYEADESAPELDSRATYDGLAAVQPDYPEPEDKLEAGAEKTEAQGSDDEETGAETFSETTIDTSTKTSIMDAGADELDYRQEAAVDTAAEPEDQFDDFSMTAGERIGQVTPVVPQAQSSSLFDEGDDEVTADAVKPRRKSLFDLFGRKLKKHATESPVAIPAAPVMVVAEVEEPIASLEPEPVVAAPSPVSTEPSEVIVINVMAKEGYEFGGHDLLQVLITTGLKFGEMNIFHQRLGNDPKAPVSFSVANILNPGTFDLNNMDEFSTTGVSLFLALPSVANNLEIFEKMLATAQEIQAALDGELRDDQRNVMTAQTIEHYRQRVSDFELRRLKAVGSHG
jgi:cell division protein ZipA